MTMSDTPSHKSLWKESRRDCGKAYFYRRDIIFVAVKVEQPLSASWNQHHKLDMKATCVVEIKFNVKSLEGDDQETPPYHSPTSKLYRYCKSAEHGYAYATRVISFGGGVGFYCELCCPDVAVTDIASFCYCEKHKSFAAHNHGG